MKELELHRKRMQQVEKFIVTELRRDLERDSLHERLMQAQKAAIEKRRQARKADHDGTS